mmetsp:Transcript_22271/g.39448  ORF Transcript_22271/g.39448 Transcript_22271/m.39448 type:complete len:390 (+) Transcript_22271:124-1293(+)
MTNDNNQPWYVALTDLAEESMGTKILFATDEWFAAAENVIKSAEPIFITDKFTTYGKWMDGWESRRKRTAGHDWAIIELGLAGNLFGVKIDTRFFTGNQSPRFSLQAAELDDEKALDALLVSRQGTGIGTCAGDSQWEAVKALKSDSWTELIPMTPLKPGYEGMSVHYFEIDPKFRKQRFTHVRLNMFPDGGIARMRLFGLVKANIQDTKQIVDLAAVENGGVPVAHSDAHYGKCANLIALGRAPTMADGWETARTANRPAILKADASGMIEFGDMNDWAILKLATRGVIHEIEIDTNHFKGNFPESCIIEGALMENNDMDYKSETAFFHSKENQAKLKWKTVLPRTKLSAHVQARFPLKVPVGPVTHIRLTIFPDGGVSRLRLFGLPA